MKNIFSSIAEFFGFHSHDAQAPLTEPHQKSPTRNPHRTPRAASTPTEKKTAAATTHKPTATAKNQPAAKTTATSTAKHVDEVKAAGNGQHRNKKKRSRPAKETGASAAKPKKQ